MLNNGIFKMEDGEDIFENLASLITIFILLFVGRVQLLFAIYKLKATLISNLGRVYELLDSP
jgi:hypothetical protein